MYLYSPYGPYGLYRASVPVQGCTLPNITLKGSRKIDGLRPLIDMEETRCTKGAQWLSEKRRDSDQFADIVPMRGKRKVVPFHAITAYCGSGVTSPNILNPLNAELNPICCLLALLGAHHFLHVSRIRVKSLTLRLLMSYICIYIEHPFLMFLDHTQQRTTVGRTPLDE